VCFDKIMFKFFVTSVFSLSKDLFAKKFDKDTVSHISGGVIDIGFAAVRSGHDAIAVWALALDPHGGGAALVHGEGNLHTVLILEEAS
jgi:hypothetical protein